MIDLNEVSMMSFDFDYKKAVKYLYEHPEAKVFVQEGIYPYIARELKPEESPQRYELIPGHEVKSIWPISFARLRSLDLLVEKEEIDPEGNGKKTRTFYSLNRIRAKGVAVKKKGRPEQAVHAATVIRLARETIEAFMIGGAELEDLGNVAKKCQEWEQLAP